MVKLISSAVRFRKIKIYKCMFYQGESMYVMYNDDSLMSGPYEEELRQILSDINVVGLDITKE